MKSNSKRKISAVMSIVLILSFCSCAPNIKQAEQSNNRGISYNVVLFADKQAEIDLLEETYFESDSIAYFNPKNHYNVCAYDYNLYRLVNFLHICEINRCDQDFTSTVKYIPDFCESFHSVNDLATMDNDKLLDLISLESTCEVKNYKREEKSIVDERFNGLFSENDKTEQEKLLECNRLLKAFAMLDEKPAASEDVIKAYLIDLLEKDDYFTFSYDELEKNVFTGGMVILENCVIYNKIFSNEEIDISPRKEWFDYWASVFGKYLEEETASLMIVNTGLIRIASINDIYNLDIVIDAYHSRIEEANWKEMLSIDPKIVYESLFVLDVFGYDVPDLKTELKNYTQFLFNFTPEIDLSEQYYGCVLSNILDYQINKTLFLETMKKNFSASTSLKAYYYFMQINFELGNIEEFINEYGSRYQALIDSTIDEIINLDSTEDLYYLFCICKENNSSKQESIIEFVNNLNLQTGDFELEQEAYWHIKLLELCSENSEKNQDSFLKWLEGYYTADGYMAATGRPDTANIYSTYRIMELLTSDASKSNNFSFNERALDKYRGPDGGYYILESNGVISDYRDSFTMQSWVYGLIIYNEIKS